ncbi:MAG TPA: VOC family protein [Chloroflexota bacterium]|nr:VOC family protein [Chloroflexota bacterium]
MTQLNYLAIMCEDPARMREWYARWLGFEEYDRTAAGSIYITDGHFSVGLLKAGAAPGEETQQPGLHHFGFQVDDILEIERNLEDFDPSIRIEKRPPEDPYAAYRLRDPEGIIVDLSERGFGVAGEPRLPGIRHLATFNRDTARKFAFYTQVMGMRDATRTDAEVFEHLLMTKGEIPPGFQRSPNPFTGDGFVNLAHLDRSVDSPTSVGRNPLGFNHFGVLVRDPHELYSRIHAATPGMPEDVRPPERQVEYGVRDPEGNYLDLSGKKGWKVDVNTWARVG